MTQDIKTLPLSTEDILSFFDNQDHFFYVDYNKSSLKRESFLTYIANMKMKCDLINYKDISREDRQEMLLAFMHYGYVIEIPVLKDALVALLLYSRSGEMNFDYMTKEESDTFINSYPTEFDHISSFFDSMLLVLPSMSHEFKAEIFDKMIEDQSLPVVEQTEVIGINAFSLVAYPDFLDMFIGLSKEEPKMRYYKYAIEKFNYKNKKLFQLIAELEKPSILMSLFNMLSSKEELETEYFEKLKLGA
jgi:hypothetical protein